jgi:alpha-1,6-mannosyltransferase
VSVPGPRRNWTVARPWHTNAALILIGFALVWFTLQLIREYDHYQYGFSGVSSAQVGLYVAAIMLLVVRPDNVNRLTFPIILTFAIACRLVALFPDPFLSTDVYRYAWDGVVQHAHINPFRYVPADQALAFLRGPNQDLYDNINRRDYAHTIYPPVAQVLFYAITWISPTVTFMKTAMVLFEGLTMWGLLRMLRHLNIRREWTLVYAWCPLLIWEFAGSGHLDSIVMAFLTLAILFRYRREPLWTGVFLGLAVLTKFYPLVLFPALYQRGDWKMPATLAAMAVGFYALYSSAGMMVFGFLGGYVQEEGIATGTRYFLLEGAQHVLHLAAIPNIWYTAFVGAIFAWLTWRAWQTCCRSESRAADFLPHCVAFGMALMLLFSPHYPWYVAWLVPLLVLRPSLTVLTYVCGLFYLCTTALAVGYGAPQFRLNELLYAAVGIAFIIEIMGRKMPIARGWIDPSLRLSVMASTQRAGIYEGSE